MDNRNTNRQQQQYGNEIDLRRYVRELRRHRWLYGAIALAILALAVGYVLRKEPVVEATAVLLIEDDNDNQTRAGGNLLQMMRSFSTGGFGNASVDNELLVVNTYDIALRTVKALDLNVTSLYKHGVFTKTLWDDAPLRLALDAGMADTLSKSFSVSVKMHPDGTADIRAYTGRFFTSTLAEKKGVSLPCALSTPRGGFTVDLTGQGRPETDGKYVFVIQTLSKAAETLYENVESDLVTKVADGIELIYQCNNGEKAKAVLNAIMAEYNAKRLERKRATSAIDVEFLTRRIDALYSELRENESKVEKFKSENNFVDIEAEAPILLETTLDAHEEMLKAGAQMLYYEQVLDLLHKDSDSMLPAVASVGEGGSGSSSGSNSMIGEYNEQMALLMELRRSAKPGNTALEAAEKRVAAMRVSIINSFTQLLASARKIMDTRSGVVGSMDSHLRNLPKVERDYINLSRDQLLKNELYAFLVERRENALMGLSSEKSLGFVIDPAYVSEDYAKKKPIILIALGLVFAIAVPAVLAWWRMRRDDRVCAPCDLAGAGLEASVMNLRAAEHGNDLRKSVMSRLPNGTLYIATDGTIAAVEALKDFSESLTRAGIAVETIAPATNDNDFWLSPEMQGRIAAAAKDNAYVIAAVPQVAKMHDLAPVIAASPSLAVIITACGHLSRKGLQDAVAGIPAGSLLAAITDR